MCQAIVKPSDVQISEEVLRASWISNPHGAGIAYLNDNGEVELTKGFFKFKHFYRTYRQLENLDCLIHFRFATHGAKVTENCHPFRIGKDSAMIHNGVLLDFTPKNGDTRSDTRVFIDSLINPMLEDPDVVSTYDLLTDYKIQRSMEHLIAGYNKLAFLTPSGFVIYNEEHGEWQDGVWYSAGFPLMYEIDQLPATACVSYPTESQTWEEFERWMDADEDGDSSNDWRLKHWGAY